VIEALQNVEVTLFRFINGTLQNSFFDVVMPFLSGNALFYPLLFILATWLIWKCGTRGRLFALFVFIVIAFGDGVICKTVKEATDRARPFATLENVHVPKGIGKTDSPSMPSSHTANWFSATMVALIFYRRSWRFMVPLACLVAFSRIYNGVHYPGDVLAGAILGSGYAVAIVFGINYLWQTLGRRWFPTWFEKLPSLVNPPCDPMPSTPRVSSSTPDEYFLKLGYLVIFLLLLGKLAYLAAGKIELSEDEAYQWLWSKHLALSYYSKPLMIGVLQWLGTSIWGDREIGVRFFSPVLAAIMSVLVLRFVTRETNARVGLVAVLILTCTPLLAVGATLMTIDPPLVLFWTAAMFAGWKASQANGTTTQWAWAGLWLGLSFLSKYSALFQIVCWLLFFALWKPARQHLRRPGPYLALLIVALCTLPVIIWNAQHDWITVHHVADNAGRAEPWQPSLRYFWDFIGSQAALLNPVFFLGMVWAMFAMWRSAETRRNPLLLFLFCMGAPVWLGYLGFTAWKRVFPNWIAPSIVPLFLLAILFWYQRWTESRRFLKPALIMGVVLGTIAVVLLHDTNLIGKVAGKKLPAEKDPLRRVRAWKETARTVGDARQKFLAEGKPVFIIGDHYGLTGEISFYLPEAKAAVGSDKPLAYYLSSDYPRNQIYFWPEYRYRTHRKGENAIYVREVRLIDPKLKPAPETLRNEFASVEDLGIFDVKYRDSRVFRRIQLFACRDLK
jgi:membrane-associated phospholipid phosphatase